MKKILLIGLLFLIGCSNLDDFSKCLTEKNTVLYGASWCPHCQAQKELFKDSIKYINYVECAEQTEICKSEGIQGYPTWKFNGRVVQGQLDLSSISTYSGCQLE